MKLLELFSWKSNPIKDWLWQRISAVVFLVYAVAIIGYWYCNPGVSFEDWRGFVLSPAMRVLGVFALASVVIHAWIGLWTVITDYIKSELVRKALLAVVVITLLLYFGVGLFLLWGM